MVVQLKQQQSSQIQFVLFGVSEELDLLQFLAANIVEQRLLSVLT